jgi:hypothetical protein
MVWIRTFALFAVYVLVVTPIGLVLRVIHDPLHRRRDRAAATYWDVLLDTPDNPRLR